MTKYIRMYIMFIKVSVLRLMAYRFNFAMSALANITWTVAQLVSLQFMFSRVEQFQGWSMGDLLLLLALGQIYVYSSYVIYISNFLSFSTKIIQGDIDFLLLKPISLKFFVSFEKVSLESVLPMFITVGPMIVFGLTNQQNLTLESFFAATLILALGLIILYFLNLSLAGLSLFIDNARQILELVNGLTDLTRVPLDILPQGIQYIFTFIIPMAFVTYYPVLALRNDISILTILLIEAILLAILIGISQLVWKYGLKSYSGVG